MVSEEYRVIARETMDEIISSGGEMETCAEKQLQSVHVLNSQMQENKDYFLPFYFTVKNILIISISFKIVFVVFLEQMHLKHNVIPTY